MSTEQNGKRTGAPEVGALGQVRFEVYGSEMIEKEVKVGGSSCRVYLPRHWAGRHVKIIRIN